MYNSKFIIEIKYLPLMVIYQNIIYINNLSISKLVLKSITVSLTRS